MFEMQSPTFHVIFSSMDFRINYIARTASKFGKSKPSWQYCLDIGKQNAALNFPKFILNAETVMT